MEDGDLPPLIEKTYVKETTLALWDGLPWVITAGVLFSLFCFPAVFLVLLDFLLPGVLLGVLTAAPAWAAMYALIVRVLLRVPGTSLFDFFRAFGRFYFRGVVLGGFLAVPLATGAVNLSLLSSDPVPMVAWIGLGADLAGLFFLFSLYLYAFPLLVIYDAGLKLALRNSFVLAVRYLSNTLGLIAMAVLLGFLAARVSWLLLVILPAAWSVFVINNCRMVLRRELEDD